MPEGQGPHACVVMAHGFSGVREQRLDAYAERFAAAGMAVLVFDYRHFGASQGQPRQLLSIARQLADWRAAVSHARNLPEVDPKRVAVWGTSFSGGHVVAVAAADPAIAAVVSQAPFTDGPSVIAAGGVRQALNLTAAGLRDGLSMLLRREPSYLPAVGPPGSVAVMTAPDAEPGFALLDPPGSTWENRVAGRIALAVGAYRPYAKFHKLRQPVFVAVCDEDDHHAGRAGHQGGPEFAQRGAGALPHRATSRSTWTPSSRPPWPTRPTSWCATWSAAGFRCPPRPRRPPRRTPSRPPGPPCRGR